MNPTFWSNLYIFHSKYPKMLLWDPKICHVDTKSQIQWHFPWGKYVFLLQFFKGELIPKMYYINVSLWYQSLVDHFLYDSQFSGDWYSREKKYFFTLLPYYQKINTGRRLSSALNFNKIHFPFLFWMRCKLQPKSLT